MLVRDPVWGDIAMPDWATSLLDSPEMQRLRRVRQLGLAYLVYPGAQHSRFEHSLGAAHTAGLMLSAIGRSQDDWADGVVAAALLHDIAHAPFGHTFEDERPLLPRHDTPQRMLRALSGQVGEELDALACGAQARSLLTGDLAAPTWARDIVAGSIDADLLDYLRRDAYFTGVRQTYDERVLQSLALLDGRLGVQLERHGRVRLDARSEVLQLFRMRYILTERVYLHHAKIAAGAMLAKAVELAALAGLEAQTIYALSDDALLSLLADGSWGPDAAALGERIAHRRLYKRALVAGRREIGEQRLSALHKQLAPAAMRREAEGEIARSAGLLPRDVVISCPPAPEFREMRVPTRLPEGIFPLDAPPGGDAETTLLWDRYRDLWQVSVFVRHDGIEAAGNAAREYFER
ncbi:MAG: HD domain-containing protein [Thermaerobacter sp.]|nr:HD domain-containing protein [Thermaerobacter sp.]